MKLPFLLLLVSTLALAAQSPGVDEALSRPILAPEQTRIDTQVWTASQVPVLQVPTSRAAWETQARTLRQRLLDEVVYRGAAREWRTQKVQRRVVRRDRGRRLSRPQDPLRGRARPARARPRLRAGARADASRRPSSSTSTGTRGRAWPTRTIQARCINLAKKGLYAINVEWIGQTQLATEGLQHYKMNQLDLVGTPGLAVFYESLRRTPRHRHRPAARRRGARRRHGAVGRRLADDHPQCARHPRRARQSGRRLLELRHARAVARQGPRRLRADAVGPRLDRRLHAPDRADRAACAAAHLQRQGQLLLPRRLRARPARPAGARRCSTCSARATASRYHVNHDHRSQLREGQPRGVLPVPAHPPARWPRGLRSARDRRQR